MNEFTLTINGSTVKGKDGDTVLEVCQNNGIELPTLCHLDGLSDIGACRMCVVEVEKERKPVPACTYPARDGMNIKTDTEKLRKYRRQMLELIFTEHNHFCMFCESSGNCELQNLAYKYQMDNVRYPYAFPKLSVDSISDDLVIDHNRCILCGRCVRACAEIAASHTISFSQRGWKTMVSADLDQSLGESSCRHCGACIQSCPTGAIISKLSLYKDKKEDCRQVTTICPACGVGCELKVWVNDNNMVKIESPDLTGPRGALCRKGRFGLLKPNSPRITSPMIRNKEGDLEECSLDKAVRAVARELIKAKAGSAGMVSTRIPGETLTLFQKLMIEGVGTDSLDTLDGEIYRTISAGIKQSVNNRAGLDIECSVEDILKADCIVIAGADPDLTNPVIGTLVRRAVDQKKARLIVINSSYDVASSRSDVWLKPNSGSEEDLFNGLARILLDSGYAAPEKVSPEFAKFIGRYKLENAVTVTGIEGKQLAAAAEIYKQAERAVIMYGEGLVATRDVGTVTAILNLAKMTGNRFDDKLGVISLKPGANSRGAWQLGLAKGIKQAKPKMLFLLLGDEPVCEELLHWLRGVTFLAVQASYYSPVIYMADAVIPSPIWAEREGEYISMDGRARKLERVLNPRNGIFDDEKVLVKISEHLGHTLS